MTDTTDESGPLSRGPRLGTIKILAVLCALILAGWTLFHFVVGPAVYHATISQQAAETRSDTLLYQRLHAKYNADIRIETQQFDNTLSPAECLISRPLCMQDATGTHDVEIVYINGVREDCNLLHRATDPTLDCLNFSVPLRASSATGPRATP